MSLQICIIVHGYEYQFLLVIVTFESTEEVKVLCIFISNEVRPDQSLRKLFVLQKVLLVTFEEPQTEVKGAHSRYKRVHPEHLAEYFVKEVVICRELYYELFNRSLSALVYTHACCLLYSVAGIVKLGGLQDFKHHHARLRILLRKRSIERSDLILFQYDLKERCALLESLHYTNRPN